MNKILIIKKSYSSIINQIHLNQTPKVISKLIYNKVNFTISEEITFLLYQILDQVPSYIWVPGALAGM